MTRLTASLLISALLLSGCGRFGDSGWNPRTWFGGGQPAAATLEPEGGYLRTADTRPLVPQLLSAGWEPLNEGRLLVVTGFAPVKGYHSATLVTALPQPRGRLSPDPDGVLRLRFVAIPPSPEDEAARLPANPATDRITVALPITFTQLAGITGVEIASASGTVALRR